MRRRFIHGLTLLFILVYILPLTATVPPAWSQTRTIHPATTQAVNIRLRPGHPPPPGARLLFADIYTLSLPPDGAEGINRADLDALALWVEPNYPASIPEPVESNTEGVIAATVNDPHAPDQYSLSRMVVPQAWDTSKGDGVVIAIVDTGVECSHPDLAGKCLVGRSFVDELASQNVTPSLAGDSPPDALRTKVVKMCKFVRRDTAGR